MDRLPVAHTGPVLALDWSNASSSTKSRGAEGTGEDIGVGSGVILGGGPGGGIAGVGGLNTGAGTREGGESNAGGWMISGGLDRTVKVCL